MGYYQDVVEDNEYNKDIEIVECEDLVYVVTFKTRAHSSGYENSVKKAFKTFISMVEYLNDRIKYAIAEWDDDLLVSEDSSVKAPKITEEFIDRLLDPTRLYAFILEKEGGVIYNPYKPFSMNVPFEISIEYIDLEV
jgi:hypothetical protein